MEPFDPYDLILQTRPNSETIKVANPTILIIENSVSVTGALNSILRTSVLLRDEFDFVFLFPKGSGAVPLVKAQKFLVVELPMLEIRKSVGRLVLYFPRLLTNLFRFRKLLKTVQPELIVSNDYYNMLPVAYKAVGGPIPYLTFVRFLPNKFPKRLADTWFLLHSRYAEKIIAVSDSVMDMIKPNAKTIRVYHELPTGPGFQYYSPDHDSTTILYISNYIPGKGLEYAIEAFARVNRRFSNWKLRFVGHDMNSEKSKRYKRDLKKLAERRNVSDQIEWCEFSNNVADEYRRAAIVLNFSESESFSMTCSEAMFIGRPVIATRCGGPEEMITNGVNGELVDLKDIQAMSIAMQRLMSDQELRFTYGKRAHQTIAEKFSLEKTTFQLIPVFKAAIFSRS